MSSKTASRTVPVCCMPTGEHAWVGFDDDDARWDLRAEFARTGLARGEQVFFFTDAATTPDRAVERLRACGLPAGAALAEGRIGVVNGAPGYDPVTGFDPAARARTWVDVTERARRQGFTGARAMGDMSWAALPGVDHSVLVDYEAGLTPLFAEIGFTAVCEYDRREFDDAALGQVCGAHPVRVLERLGALDITATARELRIAGEADLTTREEFDSALTRALTGSAPLTTVDLSALCFMDVHSAALLVHLASRLPRTTLLEVRCRPRQLKLLRFCGAAQVPQLLLSEG
ncbi:MEDS domain-containing protein [Streptomyces sp. YJ-C3]